MKSTPARTVFVRFLLLAVFGVAAVTSHSSPAAAQPFGAWLVEGSGYPTNHAYLEIPHAAALNTPTGFTYEAWVAASNNVAGEDCRSLAGKNYLETWWVGICNVGGVPTLRSYLKGGSSSRNGGALTRGAWTHVAVVYDKVAGKRRHYVNGNLVASFDETGNLPTNDSPIRIGSDEAWERSPGGSLNLVRIWKKARTEAEIRANINRIIPAPKPAGLIGQWLLAVSGNDTFGVRNGTFHNGVFLTFPAGPPCTSGPASGSFACLGNRFSVGTSHRDPNTGTVTSGTVFSTNSGDTALFQLFSSPEVLTKSVNACSINSHHWILASAIALHPVQVTVFDTKAFEQKIYFFYPDASGVSIPSIVDTGAFATCP
jgi:hypothetical protein